MEFINNDGNPMQICNIIIQIRVYYLKHLNAFLCAAFLPLVLPSIIIIPPCWSKLCHNSLSPEPVIWNLSQCFQALHTPSYYLVNR